MDPVPTPTTPPAPVQTSSVVTPMYASFGKRFLAAFIDGIILGFIGAIIDLVLGITAGITQTTLLTTDIRKLIGFLIGVVYAISFIGAKGQTPGKMAMNIKVVDVQTGKVPGFFKAFLREIVGKTISLLVLALGYLWPLWDQKKQAWHDKIAGTIVVKA